MDVQLPPFTVNEKNPVLPQSQTIDWGTALLRIPEIHALGFRGEGMKAAVLDTGMDLNNPDLQGAFFDTVNTTNEPWAATHGHGSGTSAIIGARDNNAGILSVAPGCQMLGVKCMFENGGGSMMDIIEGIYAARDRGVDVINMSLGSAFPNANLEKAVNDAVAAGVYVVCSAGNAGQDDSVVYPARYPNAYAIGAINQASKVSAFSSRGDQVDVAAPGERVLTAWQNGGFARVSGTSFSAPYVTGLVLLFKQASKVLTKSLLAQTSIDIETPGKDEKSGHGLINPYQIIVGSNLPTPSVTSSPTPSPSGQAPSPTPSPSGDPVLDALAAYNLLGDYLRKIGRI